MNQQFYHNLYEKYETDEKKKARLLLENKLITIVFDIAYPALLLYLLITRDARLLRVFLVPALSFLAVTLLRRLINAKRPYEIFGLSPFIPRKGTGKSFPSRHVFSAFMITLTYTYIFDAAEASAATIIGSWVGTILFLLSMDLASIRVRARLHFVRDVVVGAILAILISTFAYGLITI